jgi:hypothetical protein
VLRSSVSLPLFGLLGCTSVLGIDEYAVSPKSSEDSALPRPIDGSEAGYLGGTQCEGCVTAHCGTENDACTGDVNCDSLRRCRRGCREPICHEKCASDLGTGLSPPLLSALYACARSNCSDECKPGAHFECACSYAPDQPFAGGRDVEVRFGLATFGANLKGLPVTIDACDVIGCSNVIASTTAQVGSPVKLSVPMYAEGFRGTFRFQETATDAGSLVTVPSTRVHGIPFTGRRTYLHGLMIRGVAEGLLTYIGKSLDPARATFSLFVMDCQANHAGDLQFEIDGGDERTKVVYWVGGAPNLDATATTSEPVIGGATAADVPGDAAITVRARRVPDGPIVAELPILTRGGEYFYAELYPHTRDQPCGTARSR